METPLLKIFHGSRTVDRGLMPGSIDPDHAVLHIVTSVE